MEVNDRALSGLGHLVVVVLLPPFAERYVTVTTMSCYAAAALVVGNLHWPESDGLRAVIARIRARLRRSG